MKENLDESFLNLLFPENDDDGDDNNMNGDSAEEASSDGINDDIESNAELTPGNTTDEEYERKIRKFYTKSCPVEIKDWPMNFC